ncbi:hypothetical protein RIF29_41469 [Crotalaria pallida]|uniref:Uncharacterized protein n=1 Tax=Crotalaria pallida TaxID=3830 RepID=A0AAN9HPE4_CROPI
MRPTRVIRPQSTNSPWYLGNAAFAAGCFHLLLRIDFGMSLRYMSRVLYQGMMRMFQGMKDQGSKCDTTSAIKSLRDSASSSKQARLLSTSFDSPAIKAANSGDKLKQAEESLRTVMYLSCWGPN